MIKFILSNPKLSEKINFKRIFIKYRYIFLYQPPSLIKILVKHFLKLNSNFTDTNDNNNNNNK